MKLAGKKILVVEDCPDQQRLLASYLRSAQANVDLECNGEAAVERVRNSRLRKPEHFDAVVMDLFLGEMDGIRATREILAMDTSIAVIAISGNANADCERRWRQAGCLRFFPKPIVQADLIDALVEGITLRQIERAVKTMGNSLASTT